jgi:ABC-type multidrug transport system fused ATPase/permease subunit
VIRAWLEHYMAWISLTQLMVPVRAQLTSLIFEKSMHKKDVKEVKKEEKEVIETGPDGKQKKPKPEDPTKTKQSTINLVSVDSKRVSEFFVFFKYFPEVAINAVLSITFLVGLIGWIPLLSGVGSFALLMPLNILVIKRYGKIQKEIMAIRDKKTTMVTEALKGMRQIKFGALENQWQEKIMKVRNEELGLQW